MEPRGLSSRLTTLLYPLTRRSPDHALGALWGLVYGVIWWVLGPMILMPLLLGMGLQFGAAFTPPMLMSLVGHLAYGLITGLVYVGYVRSRLVGSGETTA